MATQVQFRRGTTAQHSAFTGVVGELTVDTDKDVVVVHDGVTAGGNPMLGKTMTDGTANGVLYLNGSKVTSSGSTLTWNGSTFAVTGALTTTGNVTLGDASTDTVTVNGYMGVGGAGAANKGIYQRNTALTGTTQYGITTEGTFNSAATSGGVGFASSFATEAAAFTMVDAIGFRAFNVTKGAGSTITNQHGIYINDQTQGANNYGITSLVSSGTDKWNIYASGTANNYFAGNVGIGTSSPTEKFSVENGNVFLTKDTELSIGFKATTAASTALVFRDRHLGVNRFSLNTTEAVFNDSSTDYDFRVESDTNTHALFVDAGNDRVGVKTSSPLADLDVHGGNGASTALHISSTYGAITKILQTTKTGSAGATLQLAFAANTSYTLSLRVRMAVYSGYTGVGSTTAINQTFSISQNSSNGIVVDAGAGEVVGSPGSYGLPTTSTSTNSVSIAFPSSTSASGSDFWLVVVEMIHNNASIPTLTLV